MKYRIEFKKSALKDLLQIPQEERKKIIKTIDGLAEEPRPRGVIKLQGNKMLLWRIRIGNYRVIYSIFDEVLLVEVIEVGDRKDIYR